MCRVLGYFVEAMLFLFQSQPLMLSNVAMHRSYVTVTTGLVFHILLILLVVHMSVTTGTTVAIEFQDGLAVLNSSYHSLAQGSIMADTLCVISRSVTILRFSHGPG